MTNIFTENESERCWIIGLINDKRQRFILINRGVMKSRGSKARGLNY